MAKKKANISKMTRFLKSGKNGQFCKGFSKAKWSKNGYFGAEKQKHAKNDSRSTLDLLCKKT